MWGGGGGGGRGEGEGDRIFFRDLLGGGVGNN